jgi:hypothetical protein
VFRERGVAISFLRFVLPRRAGLLAMTSLCRVRINHGERSQGVS